MTGILFVAFLLFQTPAADPAKILEERDPAKRAEAVLNLLRKFDKSMTGPLLKVADADPAPEVRKLVVDRMGRLPDPAVLEFLERHATSDPDAEVALLALDQLRARKARDLGRLFEKRLALARTSNDAKSLEIMTAEHQRWLSFSRGATLPAFLQDPPPVFEAIPPRKSLRVLAFSDFGNGSPEQRQVASAAAAWHRARPFDLGMTIGDNFLMDGMTGTSDPRWKSEWEDLYGPLRIPIFATLGNHNWGYTDSPAAQILYSHKSRTWRMPALYYSFTAGPVQFFALATPALSETQLRWLDRELGRSTARWKVVYGHYSIYSHGMYGGTPSCSNS